MKFKLYIFIIIGLTCNGQSKTDMKTPQLDLTITYPKINHREIPKTWISLKAIQNEWIKVEIDKDGYLIYQPCDGSTATIKFEKGEILINWGIEVQNYYIEKFTRIIGNTSFRLDASVNGQKSFEIKVRIVDYINGIVVWEFNGEKWLMTPKENYKYFRIIKNNCITEKRPELSFLPIEF
jgi:hypothetical protein